MQYHYWILVPLFTNLVRSLLVVLQPLLHKSQFMTPLKRIDVRI